MKFKFNNSQPIYLQLVEQLKRYIIIDEKRLGERLPSVRELALLAGVNPNTVQKALLELEQEKLIFTERTNGKFITNNKDLIIKYKNKIIYQLTSEYVETMKDLGIEKKNLVNYLNNKEEE